MSETLWKCNGEQLPSVKQLLGELKDNIAVLGLPGIDGVEQVAWVMIVADDFGYVCLDKGKRELVNVIEDSKHNVETSHTQCPKQ